MTLDSMKTEKELIADAIGGERLLQEVIRLVEMTGVPGLLKQFQDKGLGNVASSLTGNGATKAISPAQLVQGLGPLRVSALATASGLHFKVVRTKLVEILPRVVQQRAPVGKAVEVAVTA